MNKSQSLSVFQNTCHEYYTCYVFACEGMRKFVEGVPIDVEKYPNQRIFIGNSEPGEAPAQSVISASKVQEGARKNGEFSDIISKSLIVRLYAEWDERCRPRMAKEVGAEAKSVKSDLMGDVRLVRHWIVHKKSIVQNDAKKIAVLPWHLTSGEELRITARMLQGLMDEINSMTVEIGT